MFADLVLPRPESAHPGGSELRLPERIGPICVIFVGAKLKGMSQNDTSMLSVLAAQCQIPLSRVSGTVRLLDEGATVPFISRYRKEATGGLDEVQIASIRDQLERLRTLEKRKQTILASIEEQGKLSPELRERIETCYESQTLEDLYLPYKPKRRTRATVAREKGLEPLAARLMRQDGADPQQLAAPFVQGEVADRQEALAGAGDIMAEWISENERSRQTLRRLYAREGILTARVVKGKESEGAKYADYFDKAEPLSKLPAHRLLAMVRGEREGFLRLSVAPDETRALEQLNRIFVRGASPARSRVESAVRDAYKRLLGPSIESESLAAAKERADETSIRVFAENLRQLLLSSPLGSKRVLAIDPGFRTGCKVVCLDGQGNLLHNETIYPHPPQHRWAEAVATLSKLLQDYTIEAVAVGNGTAGRETEQLLRSMELPAGVELFSVSEDGASVYSASAVAREEFPDYDVTVRGAVSIGRRLIDPLAELVKIDPKSIGVGQYQHDVDQAKLKHALDDVVESCVNKVGVNLNTASKHLLMYVSGLGPVLAQNIVDYRAAHGAFTSRKQLLEVPRLGAKAFEQCAGFLRIPHAENPLDNSAVHPESYGVVERMARDLGVSLQTLLAQEAIRRRIDIRRYVTPQVGLPTLTDILAELAKPGRDPRSRIQAFSFADVHTLDDLREGMILPGIVTNLTAFGVFVDVGVKQDGLIHISQLADRYVADPADVVHLQQQVRVKVLSIDRVRGRIALSLRAIS